jgi:hypothetical protein
MEVVSDSIFLMASAFFSRRICSSAESSGACNTVHCTSPNMDKTHCKNMASQSCPENMKAIFFQKQFQHLTEKASKDF